MAVTTFSVSRAVPRHVRCEHCGAEYVYHLSRVGIGEAGYGLTDSQEVVNQKAANAAFADLWRELDTGAEAVPCPACFKYQAHMTAAARAVQWGWVRGVGGQALGWLPVLTVGAVFAAVIAFPNNTDTAITIALAVAGVLVLAGLIAALAFRLSPCEPNRWSESYRAQRAAALAWPRADFNQFARNGDPYVEDLVTGREQEYEGVTFLWVPPEEIESEATVPLVLAEGQEVQVELSDADDDAVFLDADRVRNAPPGCRVCLRVFSVYRPRTATADEEPA
ncbi:MAG: hypothetical protein J0I06_25745 [Planctomycetes bacterium]|nr:hypothetical protein [Planctomycetota bacterium]